MTDNLLSYMTMREWFVWETPKHILDAHDNNKAYERDALKKIFGDLITDTLEDA